MAWPSASVDSQVDSLNEAINRAFAIFSQVYERGFKYNTEMERLNSASRDVVQFLFQLDKAGYVLELKEKNDAR